MNVLYWIVIVLMLLYSIYRGFWPPSHEVAWGVFGLLIFFALVMVGLAVFPLGALSAHAGYSGYAR